MFRDVMKISVLIKEILVRKSSKLKVIVSKSKKQSRYVDVNRKYTENDAFFRRGEILIVLKEVYK